MKQSEHADALRRRIRAGDRQAFADLYDEHARAVYHHALRLTGDWSDAEEIMSDTFLTAWSTRERVLPDGGSLRPWLLGIATHKAHNAHRSLRRRLTFLARTPAPPPVDDFADETAGRIDDARRLAAVQAALHRLRRPEREVLALCVWSGLDYAQAAEALDIPVGTVRSRLSRARERLSRLSTEDTAAGPARQPDRRNARSTEPRRTRGEDSTEPRRTRGEVTSRAAFASLPAEEETP